MKGQKLQWSIQSDFRMSSEKKQMDAERLREKAGRDIYRFLREYYLPAVIDIEEYSFPAHENELYDTFRIEATVTPVIHQHVTIFDNSHSSYGLRPPSRLKRLWWKVLRMIRRG